MRWMRVVMCISWVLIGCASSSSEENPTTIHTAWITALREYDRQRAQMLAAPDVPFLVDNALKQAQYLKTKSMHGPLSTVDISEPTADGASYTALSRWRLERNTICFTARLARADTPWLVVDWEEVYPCPQE